MRLTAPSTRSPGKLAIMYNNTLTRHQAVVNFITGVDIEDVATIRTNADALGEIIKACLTNTETLTGFRILASDGSRLYEENFASAKVGTHAVATGVPAYYSATVTIPGNGVPTLLAAGSGRTIFRLFTRNAVAFPIGGKYLATPVDAAFVALQNHLKTNLRYFADFYGQHADPSGVFACQFNAAIQRRIGT